MIKDSGFTGDSPKARFGHTITPIGKERAILFGGAVGDNSNKYVITGDTFLCEYIPKRFRKLESRGAAPSNRAAHASVCIDHFMFVYGGALGGGQLADDQLYELDLQNLSDKAFWAVKMCKGISPKARYGHVMGYLKPFLIIHGGNTGNEPVSDVWVNDIMNNAQWKKAETGMDNPPPRVYHSASICRTGTANGMMVIFGGRGADGSPLNDTWGLRKHRDNRLDWMKAPYRNISIQSKPIQRYQHRTLFIGTLLLIIGGRNNNVGESMPLDIYDTDTSEWHKLGKIDRFRHVCYLLDTYIYIHGGFDQELPTVPTDSIIRLDLNKLFSGIPPLMMGLALQSGKQSINHNIPLNKKSSSHSRDSVYSSTQHGKRHAMDIEHPRRQNQSNQTNRSIRLCHEAIVANYDDENDVKKIKIEQLQSEHRKLVEPGTSTSFKDNAAETIAKFFLGSLYMRPTPQLAYPVPLEYLEKLLNKLDKILTDERALLRIRAPVKIFGDLHGQIGDLNRFFEEFGGPDDGPRGDIESTNYVFLGDFIDRGTKSLELLLLIFNLKIKYPQNIYIIRGSHEDKAINRSMGFGDQCQIKLKQNIDNPDSFFQKCNRIFEKMPIAALVDDSYLCVHGGIGSTLSRIQEIQELSKPIIVNHDPKTRVDRIVYDILWSDPCKKGQPNGSPNLDHDYMKTKANLKFSDSRTDTFCADNELSAIIRTGEPFMNGLESRQSLISIFSCSDYGGCGNKATSLEICKNDQIKPMILDPISARDRWMEGLDRKKNVSQQELILRSKMFTPPK